MELKRNRKIFSIKNDLIEKSYEVALAATQIFNSPLIKFKTESFIVLMMIAWTYILHAYYHQQGICYQYYEKRGKRKKYINKYWDLEHCLKQDECPLSPAVITNIQFLLQIRHEIEHCKTERIDDYISAKLFACCYNFSAFLKLMSKSKFALEKDFGLAIQFARFNDDQINVMKKEKNFKTTNIGKFISNFEKELPPEIKNSQEYSYGVYLLPKTVNREGQADSVVEIVKGEQKDIESLSAKAETILIQERNVLDQYPLTSQQIITKLKGVFPSIRTSDIQKSLSELKGNKKYHYYNFSSPKWKREFERTGKPRYCTHIYNQQAYNRVKSMLEEKYAKHN